MIKTRQLLILVSTLLLATLFGCQSTSTFYRGLAVAPEYIVPIPGGATNERWETFDLSIVFSYTENNRKFDITGKTRMSEHYQMNYGTLTRLDVYLLFLDHNLRVVKTARLHTTTNSDTESVMPFDQSLTIPDDAASFSFAYDGVALESGDKKRSPHFFWLRPK